MSTPPSWFSNGTAVNRMKKALEKSGIPLELKTRKIMKDKEYRTMSLYYSDHLHGEVPPEERILRELDVYAYKTIYKFKIANCVINFRGIFFIECKHREDLALVFFKNENERLLNLPLPFRGKSMLYVSHKNYTVPLIATSHSEMKPSSQSVYKDKSVLYNASNQAIAACHYMYKRQTQNWFPFRQLYDRYKARHTETSKTIIRDSYTDDQIISEIHIFNFDLAFTIVNFNEDTTILEAEFDYDSGEVTNLNDIGYCVYPILPSKVDRYNALIESSFEVPVFTTNLNSFQQCIIDIEEGIMKTAKEIESILIKHPHNLTSLILDEVFP